MDRLEFFPFGPFSASRPCLLREALLPPQGTATLLCFGITYRRCQGLGEARPLPVVDLAHERA